MLGKKKSDKREALKEAVKPDEPKAPAKKPTVKRPVNPDRVAVLETHVGERLIIRSNPTAKAVKEFVAEQNRRHSDGEPGGPSGLPAFQIHEANFFDSEAEIDDPTKATKIKLPSSE